MALSNYTDLQAAIVTHANRDGDADFVAVVPDLIALAHSRLNRELRCRQMETSASVTLTSGVGTLPTGYLEFIEVKDGNSPASVLSAVDQNFGDSQYAANSSGRAAYFSILGTTIKTFPASDTNLTVRYYKKIDALPDATDETNWVLDDYPGLYLYGALIEGSAFMMDDARMATWGALYDRIRQSLIDEDVRARFTRASARVRYPTP